MRYGYIEKVSELTNKNMGRTRKHKRKCKYSKQGRATHKHEEKCQPLPETNRGESSGSVFEPKKVETVPESIYYEREVNNILGE